MEIVENKLENEWNRIKNALLELGKMYTTKISDENFYGNLINDTDFNGRTALKIIWEKSFENLMDENDPKAENIMLRIWHGKEATKWDGIMTGYSSLTHILSNSSKKLTGTFWNITSNYFEPNFKVDYAFQYRYRSKTVSFFFWKEFYCALWALIIMQYCWIKYVPLFTISFLGYSSSDYANFLASSGSTTDTSSSSNSKPTFTPTTDDIIFDLNNSK